MKFRVAPYVLLAAVSASAAGASDYTVKSFKLLGDEILSKQLTAFATQHQLAVVDCNLTETDMICIFEPHDKHDG